MKKESYYTITPAVNNGFYVRFCNVEEEVTTTLGWFPTTEQAETFVEKDKFIRNLKNKNRRGLIETEIPF